MKKIETVYIILHIEDNCETIAALNMYDGLKLQAVTSRKILAEMSLTHLKRLMPEKKFRIVEFKRISE